MSSLTHDLRTPLAIILGFADLLGKDEVSAEERKDYARRIATAAVEMRELLDEQARKNR